MPDTALDWLEVYTYSGGSLSIAPEECNGLDAAVEMFVTSGGMRDSLLRLTGWVGETIYLKASDIAGWSIVTHDVRVRAEAQRAAVEADVAAIKAELGIFE